MRLRPFCCCLVDSKDLLLHNFLVILCLPRLLCMYEILSLCTYLFVFCHLYASFSQTHFIRFYYVYIYCNYLHLQKSKLLRLSLLSESLKCSIFVLSLLIAESNTDIGRGSPCWMTIVIYLAITIYSSSLSAIFGFNIASGC